MASQDFQEFRSLKQLQKAMAANGVRQLFLKKLAPNDNSKNQVYLGGSFDVLNIIPFGDVTVDINRENSKRDRFKAPMALCWLDTAGNIYPARETQLILYPKYPEVRMSGFLTGCEKAPSESMRNRYPGRLLFLGIKADGTILAHATLPDNPLYFEIEKSDLKEKGVFLEIPVSESSDTDETRHELIDTLRRIHEQGWLESRRLDTDGNLLPCRSSNCGGYTLEALLGVTPNGYAEPDYLGWEIKQHGVKNFEKPGRGGAITLMTPNPTGGFFKDNSMGDFLRKYGYPDRGGKHDRINFGGIYKVGKTTEITGLSTVLEGFDIESGKINKLDGGLHLLDGNDNFAASWSFSSMLELWNRKHAKAAYIPSQCRTSPERQYRYGHIIELGVGTNFSLLVNAMALGSVYLDPALKIENFTTTGKPRKCRYQFRIKPADLATLYAEFRQVNLLNAG